MANWKIFAYMYSIHNTVFRCLNKVVLVDIWICTYLNQKVCHIWFHHWNFVFWLCVWKALWKFIKCNCAILKVYKGLLLDQLVGSLGYNDHVVDSQGPEKQEFPLLQHDWICKKLSTINILVVFVKQEELK